MGEDTPARPPRVLVPELAEYRGSSEENEILLRREERDHARSRRLRDGDAVVVLDGKGLRARARLTGGGSAVTLLSFEESSSSSPLPGEPATRVTVALACAEPARVEWAIEKGTECGAAGFLLLDAGRSQRSHVAALSKRIPRLVRIVEEATKQCDRTIVPFVDGPKSTEDFLRGLRGETLIVADPRGAPIASVAPGAPSPSRVHSLRSEGTRVRRGGPGPLLGEEEIVIAVGPEGGFTPAEILLFEEEGALRTSFGARVLRLETAVVVALTKLVDPA